MVPNPHVAKPPIPLNPSSTHLLTTPAATPQMLAGIIGLMVRGKVGGVILMVTVQVPARISMLNDFEKWMLVYHDDVAEEVQTWYFRPELKTPPHRSNDTLLSHYPRAVDP